MRDLPVKWGGMGDFKKWGVDTLYRLCFPLVMHVKITGASFLSKKMLQEQWCRFKVYLNFCYSTISYDLSLKELCPKFVLKHVSNFYVWHKNHINHQHICYIKSHIYLNLYNIESYYWELKNIVLLSDDNKKVY